MISINKIVKKYENRKVLNNASLELKKSEHAAIMGPSGSGKTTLLRIIAGLEMPDEGEIYINGIAASRPGWILEPYKRNLGFVFQTPALWPHMIVEKNIMFGIKGLTSKEVRKRAVELMEGLCITHLKGRYPDEISGGEARRVSIARALAPEPSYLLMDEPLVNLDSGLSENVMSFLLDSVRAAKASLIYVTHDMKEAESIPGSIYRLAGGILDKI